MYAINQIKLHINFLLFKNRHNYTNTTMENVVVASFDPTIFSSRPLSDLENHKTLPWSTIKRDFPRLCTIHLATKLPVVLATSSTIRKYNKAGVFPRNDAIFFDPFTRHYHIPVLAKQREQNKLKLESILNREPTDEELIKFFKRCHNLAKSNFTRTTTHIGIRRAIELNLDSDTEEEDEHEGACAARPSSSRTKTSQADELTKFLAHETTTLDQKADQILSDYSDALNKVLESLVSLH